MPQRSSGRRRRSLNQLLGCRHRRWQHRDSEGNQSQAVPGSQVGWAGQGDEDGKAREKYRQHGSVGPLGQKAKPAVGFPTSRNCLPLTSTWESGEPQLLHLLHQEEPHGQCRALHIHRNLHALFCPFPMLTAAEGAHQYKPASHQLFPLCSSPSTQWAQGVRFFSLSSSDFSVSLKYSDDLVLFSAPPHQILPLLVKQWISPRHRRLIYTLQGLK